MLLKASKSAQYFIHGEYHQVELVDNTLIVSSNMVEEHIPFLIWNGSIRVCRGILWGQLEFRSHIDEGKQTCWLVQGLPWSSCVEFAKKALASYEAWHNEQCRILAEFLPQWHADLDALIHYDGYLPHSKLSDWKSKVNNNLSTLSMSIKQVNQRFPHISTLITNWYTDISSQLDERNNRWVNNETGRWDELFTQIESSPLNISQQQAVLLNDDNNLVLAGAGSGKTSVLMARVAYLLESKLAQPDEILMLAFGREAANEMQERLLSRIGPAAKHVQICTFHQLGLNIIKQSGDSDVLISSVATDEDKKGEWVTEWLKKHWMTPTNYKRWQKHLSQWPIAYITGDDELGSHVEDSKLIAWLIKQLDTLAMVNMSKKDIQQKLVSDSEYSRLNSELALVWPCYQSWGQMLKENNEVDFNLMISNAIKIVKRGRFKSPWRHIMIDEYQDISPERLLLIESLCHKNKKQADVHLYAVGDDWQSIYEFAGSEVDLTTGFKKRFPHSVIKYLDTTYRFNDKIGAVANQFIQQNPEQLKKTLNSYTTVKGARVCLLNQAKIEKILDGLNRKAKEPKTLLMLGRNHYHRPELYDDWQDRYSNLNIRFMTCHASKGKEADYVIVLNVDDGQFPAQVKKNHIDTVLMSKNETYPYAEERRLFYVAMTRAKEKVWLAYSHMGSSFIEELRQGQYLLKQIK
ncbi:DNA helicase IV [Vibrio salinus]|uniref:DNA helicase IV n=1 Tax=Vibrio salinus TaxID=2899784 RepID=UPI001E493410|nr:DNA helicase IV [Vibrio salinus]MCE0496018.1 DNA helicase IV [Vibrio salinus]